MAERLHRPRRADEEVEDEAVEADDHVDDTAERPAIDLEAQDAADQAEAGTDDETVDEPDDEPDDVERTRPRPVRELRLGRRREVTSDLAPRVASPAADREPDPQQTVAVAPVSVVAELSTPVADPVIGPQLAAARRRLALGVDGLAERTRIRPHVIEAIEVDDFGPCGGDFYARGHLRTLARVLGVDAAPLVAAYDERYADAPIDPRRVFEAELASAHQRRSTAGPNWTLLVGALMALVLVWSVARLFLDQPTELRGQAPVFRAAATPKPAGLIGEPVTVKLTASAPAHVTVRNADGRIVLTADLAAGRSRTVRVVPPVKVTASHGNAVRVAVDGQGTGLVGGSIRQASHRYAAAESS